MRHIVVAPAKLAADREVLALNDPARGVVAAVVRRSASPALVLSELLVRAGKDRMRGPVSTSARLYEEDAKTWLGSLPLRHLVLLRAEAADDRALATVHAIAEKLGAEVWRVADETSASRVRARFIGDGDEVPYAVFLERVRASTRTEEAASPEPPAAAASIAAELAHLRASGNRDAWVIGFDRAAAIPVAERRTPDLLSGRLRAGLAGLEDPVCLAAAARGAAAALVEYGWRLRFDLKVLAGATRPAASTRARGLSSRQINGFYDPLVASALVLDALQLGLADMRQVTRAAVDPDGAFLRVGADRVDVPLDLRHVIRAQLALPSSRPGDPLLGDPFPVSVQWLLGTIVACYAEHNVLIAADDVRDRPCIDRRWLLDRGIALDRPDSARRPARSITYDPEETGRAIRAQLAEDWATGLAGTWECRCPERHVPPKPAELAPWPVAVNRAPVRYDTGIRHGAYRRYSPDFQKRWGS